MFSKGQGHSQELRVWFVLNYSVIDANGGAPIFRKECKTWRLAFGTIKNEFTLSAPFHHDVNSFLGRSFCLLCCLCQGEERNVVYLNYWDKICWVKFGKFVYVEEKEDWCKDRPLREAVLYYSFRTEFNVKATLDCWFWRKLDSHKT